MEFEKLKKAAELAKIDLEDFYLDAEFSPNTVSEWKKANKVPSFVAPMLYGFIRTHQGEAADDKIIISLLSGGGKVILTDSNMSSVKFALKE